MAKRRVGSQIDSLTPDQKKSRIDPIYLAVDNVRHTIGNLLIRATTLLEIAPRSEVCLQSYGVPKLRESPLAPFRDSHSGVSGEKSHLDVGPVERSRVYYKGEGGGFPQVRDVVSLVCPCCPWFVLAPKVLQLCTNHFVWVVCRPVWVSKACQLFLVPSQSSNRPLYSLKCCELGSVPRLLPLSLSFIWTHIESFQELGVRQPWPCPTSAASLHQVVWPWALPHSHHLEVAQPKSWAQLVTCPSPFKRGWPPLPNAPNCCNKTRPIPNGPPNLIYPPPHNSLGIVGSPSSPSRFVHRFGVRKRCSSWASTPCTSTRLSKTCLWTLGLDPTQCPLGGHDA
jgi:hypothetical protein